MKMSNYQAASAAVVWGSLCLLSTESLTAAEKEVRVRPLSASYQPDAGYIGMTRIEHRQREMLQGDLADHALRVAISENVPSGAGAMLRASSWVAALAAARNVSDPLFGHSFTLDIQGRVDGPSAGALFAVGMLAALRGDTLFETATMTGALLPDGGVGRVGGVRQKLDAAQKGGMRKVVLPDSMRVEVTPSDVIDTAEYGESIGLEVAFVSSLDEAYYELTGVLLRPPLSTNRGTVVLPGSMMQFIRNLARQRLQTLTKALEDFRTRPQLEALEQYSEFDRNAVLASLELLLTSIDYQKQRGATLMQEGVWIAAYDALSGSMLDTHTLLAWRRSNYAIADDTQIGEIIGVEFDKNIERRVELPDAAERLPADAGLLQARAMSNFYDLIVPLTITDSVDNYWASVQQENAQRKRGFWESVLGAPENNQLQQDARNRQSEKTLLAYRYRAAAAMVDRPDITTMLIHPDLLASSLVFRDVRAAARPLNLQRAQQWAVFAQSSFSAATETLGQVLAGIDEENAFYLSLDPTFRRATAVLQQMGGGEEESTAQETAQEAPEPAEPTARDWFELAAFYTHEQIEMQSYLVRLELGQLWTGSEENPGLQAGSLRRILERASENAREVILKARNDGYMVLGPSYDYLLAEGLKTGNAEDQFKALRLYWSAAGLCNLLDACTQP